MELRKKMKVMILTWLFPPTSGGIESYAYNLAKKLSENHTVTVVTCGKKYPKEGKEKFKIYRLEEIYPRGRTAEDDKNLKEKLYDIFEKEKPDIIHSHNLICLEKDYTEIILNLAKEAHIPLVDHCHDARYIKKELAKSIDNFFAVSEYAKKALIRNGINKNKIDVVYNSVNVKNFDPEKYSKKKARELFGLPQDKRIIVFPSRAIRPSTGEFGEQKNFITLLDSVKKIKENYGPNFLVVFPIKMGVGGNAKTREKTLRDMKEKLEADGCEENVRYVNKNIPYGDMPLLYKAADIMCTPSIGEAFGLVFVESMAMKLPTIGARSGAVPEIIQNKKNGFLIDSHDSEELANIIVNLLKDDKLRKDLGERAREFIVENFSEEKMIKDIEALYKEIIEGGKDTNKKGEKLII